MDDLVASCEALNEAFKELADQQKSLSQECHALRHATYLQDCFLISCLQAWQKLSSSRHDVQYLLLHYFNSWRDFKTEKHQKHADAQFLLLHYFTSWRDVAKTKRDAEPADVDDLLHPDGWRETAESEKKSEPADVDDLLHPDGWRETAESEKKSEPADVDDLLHPDGWRETAEPADVDDLPDLAEIWPSEDEEFSRPEDVAEADSPLQVAVPPRPVPPAPPEAEKREASFRRLTRLALARFAWLKQRKELRFLLSCTLWRWSLTSSRRRCLGARSYLRNRYQQVADWHNLLAAFHRWRNVDGI
eukprot:s579_g32.t2